MMTQGMLVGHWHSLYLNTTHGDGQSTSREALGIGLVGGGRARYRGMTGQFVNGNSWGGGGADGNQNEVSGSMRSNPTENIPTMSPYILINYEVSAG